MLLNEEHDLRCCSHPCRVMIPKLKSVISGIMGLRLVRNEPENRFVVMETLNGNKVELFGSEKQVHCSFPTVKTCNGFPC